MSDEIIFSIPGMACCSCIAKIENVLKEQSGVVDFEIDFESKTATVETSSPVAGLITVIKAAGYEAELIK